MQVVMHEVDVLNFSALSAQLFIVKCPLDLCDKR